MKNIINTIGLDTVNFIKGQKGEFRVVSKVKAGFMSVVEFNEFTNEIFSKDPSQVLGWFNKGAIQSVEFKAEGTKYWLTVFARVGKKIKMVDEDILRGLKVGVLNPLFSNTDLYSQHQYQSVNAKTWDSFAFVMNEEVLETV
jgi:hypothetical protein